MLFVSFSIIVACVSIGIKDSRFAVSAWYCLNILATFADTFPSIQFFVSAVYVALISGSSSPPSAVITVVG